MVSGYSCKLHPSHLKSTVTYYHNGPSISVSHLHADTCWHSESQRSIIRWRQKFGLAPYYKISACIERVTHICKHHHIVTSKEKIKPFKDVLYRDSFALFRSRICRWKRMRRLSRYSGFARQFAGS